MLVATMLAVVMLVAAPALAQAALVVGEGPRVGVGPGVVEAPLRRLLLPPTRLLSSIRPRKRPPRRQARGLLALRTRPPRWILLPKRPPRKPRKRVRLRSLRLNSLASFRTRAECHPRCWYPLRS